MEEEKYQLPEPRLIPIVDEDSIVLAEAVIGIYEQLEVLKGMNEMAIYDYMVAAYAQLVKAGRRNIENLPAEYQIPVAEYLAAE